MKYNVGDLILETCFKYQKDYSLYYITWADEQHVELLHHASNNKHVYDVKSIDRWIERNNAKHYPVSK